MTDSKKYELNCGELELFTEDITLLRTMVEQGKLPESEGGFFYGHQFQEESAQEYRDYDLEFCLWAESQLTQGNRIYYSCWW